jgi:hypothetical protein
LSEAIARHGEADVSALRARRDDPAARCALGAVYARRNDLPRAALYLAGCEHADLPDDIALAVRDLVRDVKRRLDASRFAALDVISHPEGLVAEIDALPGESFTTPMKIWIAPGAHLVRVIQGDRTWDRRVTAEPHKDGVVVIETRLDAKPPAPRTAAVDFGEEPGGALGEQHTAPPPAIKHPPLTKDKYRGIPDAATEAPIDDPLAGGAAPSKERAQWLGLRLGGGMFDDSAATARVGIALAVAGRYRLSDTLFAAARVDWSRRGGEVMTASGAMSASVDVLGGSAGIGATVLGRAPPRGPADQSSSSDLALALIAQLRADLRLTDLRDTVPVHRAGVSFAGGAELALPSTPFTVGLRFEQGVTELVAGARDRAILAEIGIDLR